jgi:hypothetical protein
MANLPPVLKQYWTDANGNPLAGGKIYTYAAGTSTPQATYTDSGAGTASANPIILDASGFADMWLDPTLSYKFVVKDSSDVTQHTIDNVIGLLTANAVGTASLQDDAVTQAKIADDAVGADQLKDSASTDADRAVTTNHVRDDAITLPKLADQSLMRPGFYNIGLAAATTTNTADSIKITGATAALSSTNPGRVILPSATAGQLAIFEVTADVTINLTGAHWGEGTKGDLTDYLLSVYAINDAGTLKWGVGSVPNHALILNADDTATASSASSLEKVLVNSALTGDSGCLEIGWFKANFDDTGGAAEDLWAVQTGTRDINFGARPPIYQKWTPTGTWVANSTYTGRWKRRGPLADFEVKIALAGAPTATALSINTPSGIALASTAPLAGTANRTIYDSSGAIDDTSGAGYPLWVAYDSTTAVRAIRGTDPTSAALEQRTVTSTTPVTFASGDSIVLRWSNPIEGWDG